MLKCQFTADFFDISDANYTLKTEPKYKNEVTFTNKTFFRLKHDSDIILSTNSWKLCDCGLSARKCNVRIWFVMPCFNQTPGRIRVVFFLQVGKYMLKNNPVLAGAGIAKHLTNNLSGLFSLDEEIHVKEQPRTRRSGDCQSI